MAYKLAEEDKLCGIEYPTYEGFKPIPKATCDMLKPQCNDIEIVLNCDKKKEEENPTPKPTPEEPKPQPEPSPTPNPEEPQPTPEPEPAPKPVLTNEELDTIVSNKLNSDGTLGKYNANQNNKLIRVDEPTPEEIEAYKKAITDKVEDIPELKGYTVEVSVDKIPNEAPEVGSEVTGAPLYTNVVKITKPNGDVYQSEPMSIGTTTETTIDLLEALPRVEDKFSKIITKDGQVVEVPEVSNEDKRAFEDKIINDLKAKLPEGTTVEAVLEGPAYEKGSEVIGGKTNYNLKVRTTLNGKVSEHTYKVPHTEEAPKEEPDVPEVSEELLNKVLNTNINFGTATMANDTLTELNSLDGLPLEISMKNSEDKTSKELESLLNEGRPDSSKYKVELKLTQLRRVGESLRNIQKETSIFSSHLKVTKPNGEVIEKDIPVYTALIDTL